MSETVYVHVCIYNYVCAMMCVYKQVYINTSVRVFTPLQLAGIDQDFSGHHALCACRVRDHIGNLWASWMEHLFLNPTDILCNYCLMCLCFCHGYSGFALLYSVCYCML